MGQTTCERGHTGLREAVGIDQGQQISHACESRSSQQSGPANPIARSPQGASCEGLECVVRAWSRSYAGREQHAQEYDQPGPDAAVSLHRFRKVSFPGMQRIELTRQIPAPPDRVWEIYTDHRGWTRWAGVHEVVLRNEGFPPPNGVGATRVVRDRGVVVEEEITLFQPPARLEYRLTAGAPIRNHHGCVTLEPLEGGTRLVWLVEFDALFPGTGWLLARVIKRTLAAVLDRLATFPFSRVEAAFAASPT